MTAPDATAGDGLREALRHHHPIMRSETGPFSGCRCGQVRLGQDVIAHVVTELRAALRDVLAAAARDAERVARVREALNDVDDGYFKPESYDRGVRWTADRIRRALDPT